MSIIYHITTQKDWDTAVANGTYQADSLHSEGFIHCSTREQILIPANERFHGQTGLILLQIDSDRLTAKLIYEDCYETGVAFPHIYGAINNDAVQGTLNFPPNQNGTFSLPTNI